MTALFRPFEWDQYCSFLNRRKRLVPESTVRFLQTFVVEKYKT